MTPKQSIESLSGDTVETPSFKVFLSYARADDTRFDEYDKASRGFVSALVHYLSFSFRVNGGARPVVWRDTRQIELSGQFDAIIEDALKTSDALVVLFSQNWLASSYCRFELNAFARLHGELGESGDEMKRRIVVVQSRPIAFEQRPLLLGGQQGYNFFQVDDEYAASVPGAVDLFFRAEDSKFDSRGRDLASRLAQDLQMRAAKSIRSTQR